MSPFRTLRRVLAGVAGLAMALSLAPSAHANVFLSDHTWPLHPADRSRAVYSAIGLVEPASPIPMGDGSKAAARGTAFMVSPCYALTAYHAVFGLGHRAPDLKAAAHAFVSLGAGHGGFLFARRPAVAVRWGAFWRDSAQDWVLLKVEGCPGADPRVGWLPLLHDASMVNGRAAVAGFDGAMDPDVMVTQTGCAMTDIVDRVMLRHYCASRPGLSGSPILIETAAGEVEVAGIVSRELNASPTPLSTREEAYANLATFVPAILASSDVPALLATASISGQSRPGPSRP